MKCLLLVYGNGIEKSDDFGLFYFGIYRVFFKVMGWKVFRFGGEECDDVLFCFNWEVGIYWDVVLFIINLYNVVEVVVMGL